MEYVTKINYEGKQGRIPVVMFMDQVNIMTGDIYSHKTHKTQFNKKVDHPLLDGDYLVTKRYWCIHQSDVKDAFLMITITDLQLQ